MSEIRCQMCGKQNPEELDVCQFCQARLKPLSSPPPLPSDPEPAIEEELGAVLEDMSSPLEEGEEQTGEEAGIDDWLIDLQTETQPESTDSEEPADSAELVDLTEAEKSVPIDYLSDDLSDDLLFELEPPGDTKDGITVEDTEETEEDDSAWLQDLTGEPADEVAEDTPPDFLSEDETIESLLVMGIDESDFEDQVTGSDIFEEPDVLGDLFAGEEEPGDEAEEIKTEDLVPDMTSSEAEAQSKDEPPALDDGFDWLEIPEGEDAKDGAPGVEEDEISWLSDLGAKEQPETEDTTADIQIEDPQPESLFVEDESIEEEVILEDLGVTPLEKAEQPEEELPQTLEEPVVLDEPLVLDEPVTHPESETHPESLTHLDEDDLSWLSDADKDGVLAEEGEIIEADLPDWLSSATPGEGEDESESLIIDDEAEEEVKRPLLTLPVNESVQPAWLIALESLDDEELEPDGLSDEVDTAEDWYAILEGEGSAPGLKVEAPTPGSDQDMISPTPGLDVGEEGPTWLSSLDDKETEEEVWEPATSQFDITDSVQPPVETVKESTPSWIQEIEDFELTPVEEDEEMASTDFPWMDEETPTFEPPDSPASEETSIFDELSPELPLTDETAFTEEEPVSESETFDWLKVNSQEETAIPAATYEDEGDISWLSDIAGEETPPTSDQETPSELVEETGNAFDWISETEEDISVSDVMEEDGEISWLSDISGDTVPGIQETEPEGEEILGWLDIGEDKGTQETPETIDEEVSLEADLADEEPAELEEEVPFDWASIEEADTFVDGAPGQLEDLLFAFSDEGAEEFSFDESITPEETHEIAEMHDDVPTDVSLFPEEKEGEIPSWLGEDEPIAPESAEEPAQEGEIPAWLGTEGEAITGEDLAGFTRSEEGEIPDAFDFGAVEAEVPDWLGGAEGETQDAESFKDEGDAEAQDESVAIPGWLEEEDQVITTPGEGTFEPFALEDDAADEAEEIEIPDWLGGEESLFAASETETPSAIFLEDEDAGLETTAVEGAIPDWLGTEGEAIPAAEEGSSDTSPFIIEEGETMGWSDGDALNAFALGEDLSKELEPSTPEASSDKDFFALESELDTLDWLETDEDEGGADDLFDEAFDAEPSGEVFEFEEMDMPEEEAIEAEMPGWLSPMVTEDDVDLDSEPHELAVSSEDIEVEEGEVPGWLDPTRPGIDEPLIRDESSIHGELEEYGPLAGLRGVLPVDDSVSSRKPSPVATYNVRVSERQLELSALMGRILTTENRGTAGKKEESRPSQLMLRLLVSGLLIIAVLLPLITDLGQADKPAMYYKPIADFYLAVDQRTPSDTILLVADYQPAFNGEMIESAGPILQHLMTRNTRIASVSTIPAGPILVNKLLEQAAEEEGILYSIADNTMNLGYLAGNANAIREFILSPQDAVRYGFGHNLTPSSTWQHPALQEIKKFEDYSQIIILTNEIESGRNWIEQITSTTENHPPIFFITSTQVGPFIQPYIDSGQVTGAVAGVSGGVDYADINDALHSQGEYRRAIKMGVIAVIALIVVSTLFQTILPPLTFKRRRGKKA